MAAHGGPGRGQGRKRLSSEPTVVVSIRMPESMREKLRLLGGSVWLRDRIKEASNAEPSAGNRSPRS